MMLARTVFLAAAALAAVAACDGDDGDTYAEMYTETDECGETHYEDSCGAFVDLNDNDVLEEELGACKVAATNYEGVSPPNSPEVLATVGCDSAAQLPTARFFWVEPNNNGAEVDRYEVTIWRADGNMVRSWPAAPASRYEQPDGSYAVVVAGLAPGEYTARVKALNSAGQSADGVSVAAVVPEPMPPLAPSVTAWGVPNEVHVKAVVPNVDDVCNAPSKFDIRVQRLEPATGHWKPVPELDAHTTSVEHVFLTVDLLAGRDATAEIARHHADGALVNGEEYRFSVVASSTHGIASPSAPVAVVARGKPRTPVLPGCGGASADDAFACHVVDSCSGTVRFHWDAVVARGRATDVISYTVRAFVDDAAAASTELTLTEPSIVLSKMSWAVGHTVRFAVRATASFTAADGTAQTYHSAWTPLTAAVPIPGTPVTPALTAAVDESSLEDRVTLSWKNADLTWLAGMPDLQRFKVIVSGSKGEASATICAVRSASQCAAGMEWPAYCLNTPCSETLTWAAKPAISYDKFDTRGLSFFVTAEANHHSGCSVRRAKGPSGIKLVGPPPPPAEVTLSRPSMRDQSGSKLHVSFSQSAARNGVRVAQYRLQLFSDLDHSTAVQTKYLNAPADASAFLEHTFIDLDNDHAYFVRVAAKNWRDWGNTAQSELAAARPQNYFTIEGAQLAFDGISKYDFESDASIVEKLRRSIAHTLTKTSESGYEVTPEMVVITSVHEGEVGGRRRLATAALIVEFDVDVPFVASGAIVPTGITAQVDRITAMRAADDLRVTLLRRSTDFAAALGADLAGTGFPFRAPLMISTAVARTEHASTFSGGVSTTSEDVGSAGDSTRYGANKGSSVAGMSSYAFVLLACGVGVIVMGGFFAVMARRRTLAGIASTPSPTGVAAAPGAAGTGSKPSSTQWKRASIKAAHAGGGGTETSFFESDLGATDEAPPASFVNPTGAAGSATTGGASEAAKRQALRKSSHQFMKQSTKQSLHRQRGSVNKGLGASASSSKNPMSGAGAAALPDGDGSSDAQSRMERTLSTVTAERGSV